MFVAEQSNNGIKSIPDGIRLTLALMTFSESYEFVSSTFFSQILVFFSRFLGYCYIAVFTGIFTVQIAREMQLQTQSIKCDNCGRMDHHRDAKYCFHCGTLIEP
jgi:voltage-gated potassium channel